jgi:UDP-N-acetylmuramoyl-tripeptide--D-alanyl-D-alanine ligase
VLGDIAHLGPESASIHAAFAPDVASAGVDLVFTFGPEMFHLHNALPRQTAAGHFSDRDALLDALLSDLREGDVVTVKSSIPSRFDLLVEALRRAADGDRVAQAEAAS